MQSGSECGKPDPSGQKAVSRLPTGKRPKNRKFVHSWLTAESYQLTAVFSILYPLDFTTLDFQTIYLAPQNTYKTTEWSQCL